MPRKTLAQEKLLKNNKKILKLERFFTKKGVHPYDEVKWIKTTAEIPGSNFKMEGVEFPDFYSQNAINIIASKYFKINRGKQEKSLKELIDRVVKTFKKWGLEQGYFDEENANIFEDELTYILLHQLAAFNSPVWFNVGIEGRSQQCSACFILDVEDDMESILDWIKTEGMIFKGGSGSGINLSKLRAKGEPLSTGGVSSGVISFMKAADAVAGSIKCVHKDTELITENGFKKIRDIKEGEKVLTRYGFKEVGKIYNTGKKDLYKLTTELGIEVIASPEHKFLVRTKYGEVWKELRELTPNDYLVVDLSPKFYGEYQKLEKINLKHFNEKPIKMPDILDEKFAEWLGLLFGDGNITDRKYTHYIGFQVDARDKDLIKYIIQLSKSLFGVKPFIHKRKDKKDNSVSVRIPSYPLIRFLEKNSLYKGYGDNIRVPEKIKNSPYSVRAAFLRGYFESDGTISIKRPYPNCCSINKEFIDCIHELLLSLGILSKKFVTHKRIKSFGKKPICRILITSSFGIKRFYQEINFISQRKRRKFTKGIEILNIRPFEQRWILPYFEKEFENLYSQIDLQYKYAFRRATSKYFRETVGKTNFNRFRALYLLERFPFLENTFIDELANKDIYYDRIEKIEYYGEEETYDLFVPEINEYLIKGIVTHNSGGTTRRAAKMVVLNVDHPEIMDFIKVKAEEENKVRALMSAGYDMTDLNNPLWQNIFFQNANNSIRVTDEFMKRVEEDKEWTTYYRTTKKPAQTYKAREILWEAAKAAWECGDPGIQFHDTVNRWNTCKNSGEIVATNPCVTGETFIATNEGWRRIKDLVGKNPILITHQGEQKAIKVWKTGTKPVYKIITRSGYELRATEDHTIYIEGKVDVLVKDLKKGDKVVLIGAGFGKEHLEKEVALMIGYALGDGAVTLSRRPIYYFVGGKEDVKVLETITQTLNSFPNKYLTSRQATLRKIQTEFVVASAKENVHQVISQYAILDEGSERKRFTDRIFNLDKESIRYILKGLFTADGTITGNPQKGFYISLDSSSLELLKQVQLLLLNFGIKAKIYQNVRNSSRDGSQEFANIKQLHSLRITRSSRIIFEREIGFYEIHPKQEKLEEINQNYEAYKDHLVDEIKEIIYDGIEDVYDLSEPITQHFVANGILVHNCSEYNWFNWTSCNLASINLLKFLKEDDTFDIPAFKHTAKIIFLAQDILITPADYPHPKIAEETKKYRTIGLGYTNLGALIMALGLPYDSDPARGLAGAITSLMTGVAYRTSTEIAEVVGPFPEYHKNVDSFLEVMEMHRNESYKVNSYGQKITEEILNEANKTWDEVIERGKIYGFRNAQATVLAPTGCLTGNSLVSTEFGLVPLETLGNTLGEKWQDLNIRVMTDEGEKLATKFFINGLAETRKIITQNGYEIIGTPEHRVKVFDKETGELKWKYFADIKEGDIVALEMNTLFGFPQPVELPPLPELHWNQDFEAKAPRHMNEELAEIIGYFMGDGSLHSKGLRFCVYKEDKDVIQRLKELIKRQFNLNVKLTPRIGYTEVAVNSVPLAIWWSACGFAKKQKTQGKGWEPHIPLAILYSNDPKVYKAFLRGIFEADGTVWEDAHVPALSTHSKDFHNQIKSLLLALGFPTKSKIGVSGWGRKNLYVLYLKNRGYALKFKEEIGFIGKRKNSLIKGSKHTPRMDRIYLSEILVKEIIPAISKKDRDILKLEFKRGGFVSRYFAQRILEQTNNDLLNFYTQNIFFDSVVKNESNGETLTYDLSVPENVTYIANGFISHNTISFMMDCDTTGIEPDFALVKVKQLVGGGWMKIVNNTVSLALKRLGYSEKEIEAIVKHLEETQNIETAPYLKPEHLAVFDCAVNPPGGQRSISLDGHIRMVAVVQSFISGAISKTFNMPNSATIEDVYNAYLNAWKLGIKCFAIYRDGSKATQALFTQKTGKKKEIIQRRRLSSVRQSETHKFSVAGHEGYLTYSMFDDGTLGEIFIRMSKQGSTLAGLLDAFAIAVSIALQYGVPLKELANKFIYMRFEPMGITNNQEIPIASSIIDYIFKYLAYRFLSPEELQEIGLEIKEESILKEHPKLIDVDFKMMTGKENKNLAGPPCKYCGGMTTRTGSCYTCLECGETSGGCS